MVPWAHSSLLLNGIWIGLVIFARLMVMINTEWHTHTDDTTSRHTQEQSWQSWLTVHGAVIIMIALIRSFDKCSFRARWPLTINQPWQLPSTPNIAIYYYYSDDSRYSFHSYLEGGKLSHLRQYSKSVHCTDCDHSDCHVTTSILWACLGGMAEPVA